MSVEGGAVPRPGAPSARAARQGDCPLGHERKLEELSRDVDAVAHDFNNVLTAILGYSSVVLARLPPLDPLRQEVGHIQRAGERGAALTAQLLTSNRRHAVQDGVVDLVDVVSGLADELRALLGEAIRLRLTLDPTASPAVVDRRQITQAISSLAIDARAAMPDGGELEIVVREVGLSESEAAGLDLAPGPHVLLRVSDTGEGMGSAALERAFEPYLALKGSRGAGFGLAALHSLVKQCGGQVSAESSPGRGTSFTIHLPCASTRASRARLAERASAGPGARVLVVEDEEMLRKIVRHVLVANGHRVVESRSGEEALRVLSDGAEPFDLVIMDAVMPGMTGREVAAKCRAAHPDLKLLMISGHAETTVEEMGFDAGAMPPFLRKPFNASDLANKVREVLHAGRLDEAP